MTNIKFFTSFNWKLFSATGREMLYSFKSNQQGMIYVYVENDQDKYLWDIEPHDKYLVLRDAGFYDLHGTYGGGHFFLNDLINRNQDIIPKEFGGDFTCDCKPHKKFPHQGHIKDCPAGGMRRRAVHWWKKIDVWLRMFEEIKEQNEEGSTSNYTKYIVWVDCDTSFKKQITVEKLDELCGGQPLAYHYGKSRDHHTMGIETGIVVFNMEKMDQLREIIHRLTEVMLDGSFRQQKRWDDAWMLTVVCEEMGLLNQCDIHPKCNHNNPMKDGPFSKYIDHFKGLHWREHKVNG